MKILRYTSRSISIDGIERTFYHTGYFESREVLLSHLNYWDGQSGPYPGSQYMYYESNLDEVLNRRMSHLPIGYKVPWGTMLHYGIGHNQFITDQDVECTLHGF